MEMMDEEKCAEKPIKSLKRLVSRQQAETSKRVFMLVNKQHRTCKHSDEKREFLSEDQITRCSFHIRGSRDEKRKLSG